MFQVIGNEAHLCTAICPELVKSFVVTYAEAWAAANRRITDTTPNRNPEAFNQPFLFTAEAP
jgi:hypothetical protein